MDGLSMYLRRAREQHMIEHTKVPSHPPKRENDENEAPIQENSLGNQDCNELSKLKSCLKPPRNEEVQVHSSAPLATRRPSVPTVESSADTLVKSVAWAKADDVEETFVVGRAEPNPEPPAVQQVPSTCEIVFTGLPGMDAYRDTNNKEDSEEEEPTTVLSAEEEEEEDASEDSDEDTLVALTNLITTTKKLSLGKTRGSNVNRRNNQKEVRERFIGRTSCDERNRASDLISRQSFSEVEESDFARPSEVNVSNFPLLPEFEREDNSEESQMFSPHLTTREEQQARNQKKMEEEEEDDNLSVFGSVFALCSSSEDERDGRNTVPPTPPNTPFIYDAKSPPPPPSVQTPPHPLFRRSSAVYTPNDTPLGFRGDTPDDKPTFFRRSSVVYTPNDKLSPPHTPPKTQEKLKPPKTEALQKTKSRIEMGSPVPVAKISAGVPSGSQSVPAKSKVHSTRLQTRLIAVADTNVLLHNLNLVENTQNYPNVTLVIPCAVVRELDGLKNGSSLTARDARNALHSLRKLVKAAEFGTTIKFQNIDEVPKSRSYRGSTRSNDDRILDCCLYYAEMSNLQEEQKVILLTNDVALQVKAESFSRPRLISAMGVRTFYEKEVWHLC